MNSRSAFLTPPAIALATAVFLCLGPEARAHRLEASYRVLPGGKVQIESWYDVTGESPEDAKVQVYGADGRLMTEGATDEKGLFTFNYAQPEALRVIVSAGAGHRKELTIPEVQLTASTTVGTAAPLEADPRTPFADRTARTSVKDVLIGVGFLLALAAFVLGVRNARELRRLKAR
jgi:hypothetical protein